MLAVNSMSVGEREEAKDETEKMRGKRDAREDRKEGEMREGKVVIKRRD